MQKIDAEVLKATKYIALWVLIFSILMQAVFLISGKWDYTVLLGNLLGYIATVGNFFLMGLGIQKSLTKEPKDAKAYMKLSSSMRLIGLLVIAVIGYVVSVFNVITVVVPYLFPRIAIALRPLFVKEEGGDANE
jgi:hypothetical protein